LPPAALPLAEATIAALLRRLQERGVIGKAAGGGWGPLLLRYEQLVEWQVEDFMATYVKDEEALAVLRGVVAIGRTFSCP